MDQTQLIIFMIIVQVTSVIGAYVTGIAGDKIGFKRENALTSLEYYGNTSSATIPLALWKALKEGKLNHGDKMVLYGFGGGLTHAGLIIEW